MKKKPFLYLSIILSSAMLLSSCGLLKIVQEHMSEGETNTETDTNTDTDISTETDTNSETDVDTESETETETETDTGSVNTNKHLILDGTNFFYDDYYTKGNYGTTGAGGISFNYYRVVGGGYAGFIKLLDDYYTNVTLPGIEGKIENTTPIKNIVSITVTYDTDDRFKIATYADYNEGLAFEIVDTSSSNPYTYTVSEERDDTYFIIETIAGDTVIESIDIEYKNDYMPPNSYNETYTTSDYYDPLDLRYSGDLVNNVTKEIDFGGGNKKTYKYYSTSYVCDNYEYMDVNSMCYTDPYDVANYYLAFGCFPANYVQKDLIDSTYKSIFGNKLRAVQTFNRTDGYAKYVPYNLDGTRPTYHELDIDLDGTYTTSYRGVGRLVIYEKGFSCYSQSSDNKPVILYTDDHYSTFREYDNHGSFLSWFNANVSAIHHAYSPLQKS